MLDIKLVVLCSVLLCGLTNSSIKKGIAIWSGNIQCGDMKHFRDVAWWYDWRNDIAKYQTKLHNCGVNPLLDRYVPMIWSWTRDSSTVTNFPPNAKYILGFNEPNHKDQANMSATEAARVWPMIEQHAGNRLLVSPSVPCGHCQDGHHNWYNEFFSLCKGCRVDILSTHMYNCDADYVIRSLQNMYHRYGKKIWLTEFSCPHDVSEDTQLQFMKDILPKLEAAPYIERYAWFSTRIRHSGWVSTSASLTWANSSKLTTLGHYYRHFRGNDAGAIIG